MGKSIIIGVIAVIILGGGGYLIFHKSPAKTSTSSNNSSTAGASKPQINDGGTERPPAAANNSGEVNVTVKANDTSASPDTITAAKGQKVNITFAVSKNGTYHGGLEFKSDDPAVDSGSIAEGESKTVSFTATKSFKFTPYWYESSIQKDYFVTVNVK